MTIHVVRSILPAVVVLVVIQVCTAGNLAPEASTNATLSSTPTSTVTPLPTSTATPTTNPTNTATASGTPSSTITATVVPTYTATSSQTTTALPTHTATHTDTTSTTLTPTSIPTISPTSSTTPTRFIEYVTSTSTLTATPTPTPTNTLSPTPLPTQTQTPTQTNIPTHTGSATLTVIPTGSHTVTPTVTSMPTHTSTRSTTVTSMPTHTRTRTETVIPTHTGSLTQTATAFNRTAMANFLASQNVTNTTSTLSPTPTVSLTLNFVPTIVSASRRLVVKMEAKTVAFPVEATFVNTFALIFNISSDRIKVNGFERDEESGTINLTFQFVDWTEEDTPRAENLERMFLANINTQDAAFLQQIPFKIISAAPVEVPQPSQPSLPSPPPTPRDEDDSGAPWPLVVVAFIIIFLLIVGIVGILLYWCCLSPKAQPISLWYEKAEEGARYNGPLVPTGDGNDTGMFLNSTMSGSSSQSQHTSFKPETADNIRLLARQILSESNFIASPRSISGLMSPGSNDKLTDMVASNNYNMPTSPPVPTARLVPVAPESPNALTIENQPSTIMGGSQLTPSTINASSNSPLVRSSSIGNGRKLNMYANPVALDSVTKTLAPAD